MATKVTFPVKPKQCASLEKHIEYAKALDCANKKVAELKAEKEMKKELAKGNLDVLKKVGKRGSSTGKKRKSVTI